MKRSRHFKTYTAVPKCRVVLVSDKDYMDFHVWEVPETGDLIYSTSPEHLGTCWLEGSVKSLEDAIEEVIRWMNWRASWRGVTYRLGSIEPPEYGSVVVEYWSEQARRSFGIALAAAGGVRRLATGQWDEVDGDMLRWFPDPMEEEPTDFRFERFETKPIKKGGVK